jgi:hypothetical protein
MFDPLYDGEQGCICAANDIEKDQIPPPRWGCPHAGDDLICVKLAPFDLFHDSKGERTGQRKGILMKAFVSRLCACLIPLAALGASTVLAADADNGRRVAETRCVTCHIVAPTQRRDVTDAPPFEVIARKFAATPEALAFAILDPHPRMNATLTRREAQDIAAYINTLVK